MTKQEKEQLMKLLKDIDVKKISIDHTNTNAQKWYRFGAYMGLRVACDIITQMPETVEVS